MRDKAAPQFHRSTTNNIGLESGVLQVASFDTCAAFHFDQIPFVAANRLKNIGPNGGNPMPKTGFEKWNALNQHRRGMLDVGDHVPGRGDNYSVREEFPSHSRHFLALLHCRQGSGVWTSEPVRFVKMIPR
jgi:hypothetical protein